MPTITHDGIETAYAKAGEGPPILLVHGAEADSTMFTRLMPHLAARGWRAIAYDQRDSGATRNPASEYTIETLADDAAGLIASLGLVRAHVFGTSLGSVVAQHLAVRHPERVDALVLSSAIRAGRTADAIPPERVARLAELRADPAANADALARFFFPEDFLAANAGILASLRSPRTPEQSARRAPLLRRPDAPDLGGIPARTLVLAGAADALVTPAHTLAIADEIPGAERLALEGVGHVGSVQAPEETATAVDRFLRGGSVRRAD